MKISELTKMQVDDINDKFQDAVYQRKQARKIINDVKDKYGLNTSELYRVIDRRPIHLMRRHDNAGKIE